MKLPFQIDLYQFLTDIGKDIDIKSFQYRPELDYFEELSKDYDTIILGHLVESEDAVFIIYGFINGEYKEYSDIPKDDLNKIEKHYNMKTIDDLIDPEYTDNGSDINKNMDNFKNRMQEVNQDMEQRSEQFLSDEGFINKKDYFINADNNTLIKYIKNNEFLICKFGQENNYCTFNELQNEINMSNEFIDKLSSCITNYTCSYKNENDIQINCYFTNNNRISFKLISDDGIVDVYSTDLNDDQLSALDSYLWDVTGKRSEAANLKAEDFDLLNNFDISICNQYENNSDIIDEDIDNVDFSQYDNMELDDLIKNLGSKKNRLIKR